MARQKHQKAKILIINDLLRSARGIENAIPTQEFCRILEEKGISCDRRTLSDDITLLSEYVNENDSYDYTIACDNSGRQYAYYSVSKPLSDGLRLDTKELQTLLTGINTLKFTEDLTPADTERLKMKLIDSAAECERVRLMEYADSVYYPLDTIAAKLLIDWINSLTFMKGSMSDRIIETLINLADSDDRRALRSEKFNPMYQKQNNNGITLYDIDKLFRAIDEKKKLCFRYFRLDENKNKQYRHDGKEYTTEPLTLTPNDGHYYLICYDVGSQNKMRTYRIDRMSDIRITDDDISADAIEFSKSIPGLAVQTFRMFSGPVESVTLEFEDTIIDNVLDKFGYDTKIERISSGYCRIKEEIQLSPPFFSWLFQFTDKMKIISPDSVVEQYKEMCSVNIGKYQ